MRIQQKFEIKVKDMRNKGQRIPKSYILLSMKFGSEKNNYHNREIPDETAKTIIKKLIGDYEKNNTISQKEREEEIAYLRILMR